MEGKKEGTERRRGKRVGFKAKKEEG